MLWIIIVATVIYYLWPRPKAEPATPDEVRHEGRDGSSGLKP
jgi:hypothetical protein